MLIGMDAMTVPSDGDIHSLTVLTARGIPWLDDLRCARVVTEELLRCEQESAVQSLAWLVLPDRVCWMLRRRNACLNRSMALFKERSARAVQCAAERSGRVWQAGYQVYAIAAEDNPVELAMQLVQAPLRAGLCDRLDQYPHWYCRWRTPEMQMRNTSVTGQNSADDRSAMAEA